MVGLMPSALGQVVQNPVRFDVSPAFISLRAVPRAQGAFLQEHRVKKLPPLPAKLAALADTVIQRAATTPLPVGPIVTFPGVGQGNFSISSDPPDTNGSVGKTHYVQWVNTGLAIFDKTTHQPVLGPVDGNLLW